MTTRATSRDVRRSTRLVLVRPQLPPQLLPQLLELPRAVAHRRGRAPRARALERAAWRRQLKHWTRRPFERRPRTQQFHRTRRERSDAVSEPVSERRARRRTPRDAVETLA
eukprot:31038-Pelagococcus_subviridis.AAC.8